LTAQALSSDTAWKRVLNRGWAWQLAELEKALVWAVASVDFCQ
jgi:hypothetical protein